MNENKAHEFSLDFFTLKGESVEKIENAVFEMFDKLRSNGIITNDPREPYDKSAVPKPNSVLMFHFYETKDAV